MSKIHYKKTVFCSKKKWGKVRVKIINTYNPQRLKHLVVCSSQKICCFVFLSKMFRLTKQNFLLFSREPVENVEVGATLKWWYWRNVFSPDLVSFLSSSWFNAKKSLKYCCCTITAVASICAVQSDHLRCFTALFRELLCSFGGNISHAFSGGIYKKISILQKKISKRGVNEYIYVSVGAVK